MTAYSALGQVDDMASFFDFVRALIRDRQDAVAREDGSPAPPHGADAGGWENVTIAAYLDASLRWAESTSMGQSQDVPEPLSWQAFATFLYVGKIYE